MPMEVCRAAAEWAGWICDEPPSTCSVSPVIQRASWEARNTTAAQASRAIAGERVNGVLL